MEYMLLVLIISLACFPSKVYGYLETVRITRRRFYIHQKGIVARFSQSASHELSPDEKSLLLHANTELLWEKYERKLSKPILNLSSISSEESFNLDDTFNDREEARDNARTYVWNHTKVGLSTIGIHFEKNINALDKDDSINDERDFLSNAPHLVRLEPSIVLDAASRLIDIMGKEKGIDMIKRYPHLLTFRAAHVSYGFEFLSNMMGIRSSNQTDFTPSNSILNVCYNKPALLLAGIDGGIQEKYVQKTLSDAGSAISGANRQIVGDVYSTFLKDRKGN
jgi:hypothetical protein